MNKNDTLIRGVGLWLQIKIGSHTVYSAKKLEELEEMGLGVRFTKNHVVFSSPITPAPLSMQLDTHAEVEASIKARGLGGTLEPDNGELLFTGYVLSGMLCWWLLGSDPGDRFFGRGSAHRASIAAMVEA